MTANGITGAARFAAASLAFAFAISGCGLRSEPTSSHPIDIAAGSRGTLGPRASRPAETFVDVIDNPLSPLIPGTVFEYRGEVDGGTEINRVHVSRQTKKILGVFCTVVLDSVYVDGALREATEDWYAQDQAGNVWYFGEDTKEFEGGKVVSTEGTWRAGVRGAVQGIIMEA